MNVSDPVPALMLSLSVGRREFNLKASGVCLRQGHALLLREGDAEYWTLPGGRIHHDETSADAIVRELTEELGFVPRIERLVWIHETFVRHWDERWHEVGFVFLYAIPPGSPWLDLTRDHVHREDGVAMVYRWFPVADLDRVRLVPVYLRHHLGRIPDGVELIVNREDADETESP